MSVYEESGFRFDFTSATESAIHDKADPHDGNTIWPGVDFRVLENDVEIWIEVKSWSLKQIRDRTERHQAKQDYYGKLNTGIDAFRDVIVHKFLGTTSSLAWSGLGVPKRVNYIVFLEPPNRGGRALLGPFQDRLRNQFKNAQARTWGSRIRYKVVDMVEFQTEFPNYPVARI